MIVRRQRTPDGGVLVELLDEAGAPVAVVSGFLRHLAARGCSPNTLLGYAYDLRRLWEFLAAQGLTWQEFSPPHALGLVLNAVVLHTTRYMDAAVEQLRQRGHALAEGDVARLSPLVRKHLNVMGHYSFILPDLAGGLRPLRDPDQPDDENDQ